MSPLRSAQQEAFVSKVPTELYPGKKSLSIGYPAER
jgi:hypothetical protein